MLRMLTISMLIGLMAMPAMAKDYYIAGLEPDYSKLTVIDIESIQVIAENTKSATVVIVFQGDKIRDRIKTAVAEVHFDCAAHKTFIKQYIGLDQNSQFIFPKRNDQWEAVKQGADNEQELQFVCNRRGDMEARIIKSDSTYKLLQTADEKYLGKGGS